jgi:signal peptidase I
MREKLKKFNSIKNSILNNKVVKIIYSVVKTIVTVILLMLLLVILVQKVSNNNLSVGGYRIFMIVSGSMVPEYNIGDILISKEVDPSTIKLNDNVVYHGEKGDMAGITVTHKVVGKSEIDGVYHFITKGVANEIADPEITQSQIYGKIIYKTVLFSALSTFMLNPVAYYLIFIVIGLLVSYQIVKIIYEDEDDVDGEGKEKQE